MSKLINIETVVATQRISEQYPQEFKFFCSRFIWACNRTGFYTRRSYFDSKSHPAWLPFKRGDEWRHLYPQLVTDLAEKHLDFERFCRKASFRSELRPKQDETAFWLGTMAGPNSYAHCIDIDSHDRIGSYGVPSRFHVDRNRHNPLYAYFNIMPLYEYRYLPVVRLTLEHFQKLKRFYDAFPNRIWAFSSANLGMGLWQVYKRPIKTTELYAEVERRLNAAGLHGTEHYPRPPSNETTKGKVHRRPCGMDSGFITDGGLVTDPIEQIRLFMQRPSTPQFPMICEILFSKLDEMNSAWIEWDSGEAISQEQKIEYANLTLLEIDKVKDWLNSGCPLTELSVSVVVPTVVPTNKNKRTLPILPCGQDGLSLPSGTEAGLQDEIPAVFKNVDLKAINASGQWVQFCAFLAEYGFPCEDHFLEVISTLTRWLYFIELFDHSPDVGRIKDALRSFCLKKNNGFITRLGEGHVGEVLDHVDRVVDNTINSVDEAGRQVFENIRLSRNSGKYGTSIELLPLILTSTSLVYSPTLCGGLIPRPQDAQWEYQPDDTPLPEPLLTKIKTTFKTAKRQLRKNKAGEYPTLKAITRLINYVYAGKPRGQRRASQQLLEKMGLPGKSSERRPIKRILAKANILKEGDYQAQKRSRLYQLSKEALDMLDASRKS